MPDTPPSNVTRQQGHLTAALATAPADDVYAAALENLLDHATRPRSLLARLWAAICSWLVAVHGRRNDDVSRLPPEYWFWMD